MSLKNFTDLVAKIRADNTELTFKDAQQLAKKQIADEHLKQVAKETDPLDGLSFTLLEDALPETPDKASDITDISKPLYLLITRTTGKSVNQHYIKGWAQRFTTDVNAVNVTAKKGDIVFFSDGNVTHNDVTGWRLID